MIGLLRKALQLLLLPLAIVMFVLYRNVLSTLYSPVLYSWYRNKKDYDACLLNDKNQDTLITWDEWREDAKVMEAILNARIQDMVKIIFRPQHLHLWLKSQGLPNNTKNRERFIQDVYLTACHQGIELTKR